MAQNDQKPSILEPQLCTECMEMFGHPNFDNLCSKCFKKQKAQQKLEHAKSEEEKIQKLTMKLTQTPSKVEQPISKKRELPKQQQPQPVIGRCSKCTKKIGMLGYNCKHCSQQFCKFHRLPEDHECGVDFVTLGRKQIKSDNPLIAKKKIEHI